MKIPRPLRSAEAQDSTLRDFGRFHRGSKNHQRVCPNSVSAVSVLLKDACKSGTPVRSRGHGHSMNGSSLPRDRELLLSSDELCSFSFDEEGSVTVGAGVLVWDLHTMLSQHGYQLLVANDGAAPAPTVGGFISAGGIGENTGLFGGFWETVREITFVTGMGEVITCHPSDELFQWMFGSMGQLGFIVEAKLAIYAPNEAAHPYPSGLKGTVPRTEASWDRYAWFTLFVPFGKAEQAMQQLGELCARHLHCWCPLASYVYPVRFYNFNPKLLYPIQKGFVAQGIWGTPRDQSEFDFAAMRGLETEFMGLVRSDPDFRRYIQTELTFEDANYRAYFGEEIFNEFLALKKQVDPAMILNRGSVF